MKTKQEPEVIYPITIDDLQNEAQIRIGRKLNDDELYTAKKNVEWDLSSVRDITLIAAIEGAIEINK